VKIKNKNDILSSILLHLGVIASFALFSFFTKPKVESLSYVEINFGLNENLVQTKQAVKKNVPDGEQEALKAKDALPQLTKNSAPKLPETQAVKPDALIAESKKPENDIKKEENKKEPHKETVKKSGKLETKDYAKRKEESLRKTSEKAQAGKKTLNKEKPVGQKQSVEDIPTSPFETVKNENTQASLTPTGDESGQSTEELDRYKLYLNQQLKLHWSLSVVSKFPSSLITVVSFTVNEYGSLNGAPQIEESSHNAEFDALVLEAINSTFPVSNPPPKEIHPPQKFISGYDTKGIR